MSNEEREMELLEDEVHRRRRNDKRQKWGLFVLAMLLSLALLFIWWMLDKETHRADSSGAQVVTEQAQKKEIAKEAQQALCGEGDLKIYDKDLCAKWAQVAQEPPAPVAQAPVVVGGPSQAELILAFRTYCDAGNCKGKDGATPTADDIAAAFVQFCSDGRCKGPAGTNGTNGTNGAPGAAAEPVGPTPEMVLAAITAYCASGACVGPAGATGPGPTQEMVLAAVQSVCSADACRGPAGEKGDKGDAPTAIHIVDAAGRGQTCVPNPPGSTEYQCTYDDKAPVPKLPIIISP